ncbi:hypothetical protein [Candidatus Electronema sp. JM]|uniref:hypothetical protein n=1 Tax=Candidatus Electronema sp. JM TaxID=3401571 RepID=UPI003AA7F22A
METNDMLFEDIFTFLKNNYRGIGVAGTLIGAFQAIFYCSSINYYPSGMTIADTLFFLWVFAISGGIYSVISLTLFRASLLWVAFFPKPTESVAKKVLKNNKINTHSIKDRPCVITEGIFFNSLVFLFLILMGSWMIVLMTIGVYLLMIVGYYALTALLKKTDSSIIVDENEQSKHRSSISMSNARLYVFGLIYFAPLIVGNISLAGGVAKQTFQTMGVRIINADVLIENVSIQEILDQLKNEKLSIKSVECGNSNCVVKNAIILFTGIGNNTKLEISDQSGSVELIIPNSAIKCIFKSKLIKQKI